MSAHGLSDHGNPIAAVTNKSEMLRQVILQGTYVAGSVWTDLCWRSRLHEPRGSADPPPPLPRTHDGERGTRAEPGEDPGSGLRAGKSRKDATPHNTNRQMRKCKNVCVHVHDLTG